MAVYAAHLTRTLQGTPSVFQVTAQEALGATVKPALRKLVEFLAATYPNKCGWCERWYDELYLIFDCLLQYHYLKHYAASFSESFYGLIRIPTSYTSEFSSGQRLPDVLERGSLALLVLVPYVRDKLERIVDKWRDDDADGKLGKDTGDRLRKAAIRTYTVVYVCGQSARLVQLGRYLRGATRAHSPGLRLLGAALAPAPQPLEGGEPTWAELARTLLTGQFGSAVVTFPMVGGAVLRAVEYGAFLVQFLRWWDSQPSAGLAGPAALPPPPLPERDKREVRWKNKCPLCLQTWRIPTVLPVSGYIFCYVCISRHVRANSACPLTRFPALETSLVRLYID